MILYIYSNFKTLNAILRYNRPCCTWFNI